jgi:hypothetical protein
MLKRLLFCALIGAAATPAFAQGQDSTYAERNLGVLAEILPGAYDNWNQVYFAQRTKEPAETRSGRQHLRVSRLAAPAFGAHVFLLRSTVNGPDETPRAVRILALSADPDGKTVRLKSYVPPADATAFETLQPAQAANVPGCDLLFTRENNVFVGRNREGACKIAGKTSNVEMQISPQAFWSVTNRPGETPKPYKMDRVRDFTCYVDIPGVGGGRAEPFVRYENLKIHDGGGQVFFKTKDGARELGLTLSNVRWAINNETGAFTRDSLVLYINEKIGDKVEILTYAFTDPAADRLGINMKSLLANCYLVSNRDAKPTF